MNQDNGHGTYSADEDINLLATEQYDAVAGRHSDNEEDEQNGLSTSDSLPQQINGFDHDNDVQHDSNTDIDRNGGDCAAASIAAEDELIIKQLLLHIGNAVCRRLDAIDNKLQSIYTNTKYIEDKLEEFSQYFNPEDNSFDNNGFSLAPTSISSINGMLQ